MGRDVESLACDKSLISALIAMTRPNGIREVVY